MRLLKWSFIPAHSLSCMKEKREGDQRACVLVCVSLRHSFESHCECDAVFHAHRLIVLFSCRFFVHFVPLHTEYRIPFAYCSDSEVTQTQNSHTMDSIQLRAVVAAAAICRGSSHNLTRSLIIIFYMCETYNRERPIIIIVVKLKHEPLNMCLRLHCILVIIQFGSFSFFAMQNHRKV